MSIHSPNLSLQRKMVAELLDGCVDGKVQGVAPAGDQLVRSGRGEHGTVALAAILLPLMALHFERRLNDRDLFGLFVLTFPNFHLTAAGRALRQRIEAVFDRFHRQTRLATGAVAALLRLALLLRSVFLLALGLFVGRIGHTHDQIGKLQSRLSRLLALEQGQLLRQIFDLARQDTVGSLIGVADAAQLFGFVKSIDVEHGSKLTEISPRIDRFGSISGGEIGRFPTSSQPSR